MKPMAHDGLMTKTEGTWAFWSPEMCEGGRAFSGYAADIWAAGVCLYIFVTGKLPFYSESPSDLMDMIKEANVPYDENMSDNLVELLQMALHKDPDKRAGVGDLLKHPFLLMARAQRIQKLSVEFARSKATNTIVEERDILHVSWVVILLLFDVKVGRENRLAHPLFYFSRDCTGVPDRYISTCRAASISVQATARRIQSSKAPLVIRWKELLFGSRRIAQCQL